MKSPIVRILLLAASLAPFGVQASVCNGQPLCQETATFVATLSDFRVSKQGNNRIATATLSFQNKSAAPIILGYVQKSAVAIDEIGNRYETQSSSAVRGIGVIERNTFDPKFTLQPGERSDARIDMQWYAGKSVAGVRFNVDLAVREIDRIAGDQFRLGREHALQFNGLTDGAGIRNAAIAAPAAVPASASAGTPVAPIADPCNGAPRCASNGPLALEVTQVTTGQQGNNHHVRINFRARNLTSERVIASYQTNSGVLLDNYGNRYIVDSRMNERVRGIGQSSRQKADPQFALQPGEARNFTLEYSRYVGKTAIGTVYSPDLVLEQLEILPSQQIRSARELNFNFPNVTAGNFGSAGSETLDAVQSINEAGRQLSEGLKSIFKKKE